MQQPQMTLDAGAGTGATSANDADGQDQGQDQGQGTDTPEGFDELDQLMQESQAQADEFGDLESLLAESVEQVREKREAKEARERVKRGGQGLAERREDEARLREWEAKHEWRAEANVVLFTRQQCACGTSHSVYAGLFKREVHRHLAHGAQRWQQAATTQADLPNETIIQTMQVPMCPECMEGKGWKLEGAREWKDR